MEAKMQTIYKKKKMGTPPFQEVGQPFLLII